MTVQSEWEKSNNKLKVYKISKTANSTKVTIQSYEKEFFSKLLTKYNLSILRYVNLSILTKFWRCKSQQNHDKMNIDYSRIYFLDKISKPIFIHNT